MGVLFHTVDCGLQIHRAEREFFIDNLMVRIHIIVQMILVDRPCTVEV